MTDWLTGLSARGTTVTVDRDPLGKTAKNLVVRIDDKPVVVRSITHDDEQGIVIIKTDLGLIMRYSDGTPPSFDGQVLAVA